jgi:hypothetical protein
MILPKLKSGRNSLSRIRFPVNPQNTHFNFSVNKKTSKTPEKPTFTHLETLKTLCIQEKDLIAIKVSSIKSRINTIKSLQRQYKIKFTQNDIRTLSEEKLETKAKKKAIQALKLKSAQKIASWWKRVLIVRKFKQQDFIFEKAARKIQFHWKKFWQKKVVERLKEEKILKMNKEAVKIQAFFKGFVVRKNIRIVLQQRKLLRNFAFFEQMRKNIVRVVLEKCISMMKLFRIKQNYLRLYKKTVEKEKNFIILLLKDSKTNEKISGKIKDIFNKQPQAKEQICTEPSSPLLNQPRMRSCTEDFLFLSPRRCGNRVY